MNDSLVDIIYSESIKQYVIILKRFPDKPVVLYHNNNNDIYDYIQAFIDNSINEIYLVSPSNIVTELLFIKDEYYTIIADRYKAALFTNSVKKAYYDGELLTDLERFELINKILELGEILMEDKR